jgi:hypothetical protein
MNKHFVTTRILFLVWVLASGGFLAAKGGGGGSRNMQKLGVTIGALDQAFPSIASYGLHYNLNSSFRISAGYASFNFTPLLTGLQPVKVTSYGLSAKWFPLMWWFAPYVGAHYSRTSATGTFEVSGESISSTGSLNSITALLGIDFQAPIGFNFGGGIHYYISPSIIKDALPMVPHVYVGWFF